MKRFAMRTKKALYKDEVQAGLIYKKLGNDNPKYRSKFYSMSRDEARHSRMIKKMR